ncbi:hypothetical protein ACK83U_19500 (plasmid) [Rhizobium sp. WW22]|uniref:COG3904 family protein n=1 Tax=unclassified Rhizobium TaxID=2613769 RepID=UPI001853F43D|nr:MULTISPECIES: hypothetical protein [unclassified Rhizobium]MBB3387232.1 hypothetical protein [Rhizobium sp. BK098]MBB3618933.1 hypothetical protein [Rhizobium sp. BK609]MBB3684592.1 hypothetical protein [Rhizobium sp. BK612]
MTIQRIPIENAAPVLLLKGEFSQSDDPQQLSREVAASGAKAVTFDSNGGNILAAMAYGRMIRSLGLATFQLRASQCASACTLAFVGGLIRQAEPGAIGVHQSSFAPGAGLDSPTAVAAIQTMTAQIMSYFTEMGVDPKLLQVSLSVPSDDMRYLTASEMQSYGVTFGNLKDIAGQFTAAGAAVPAPPSSASQEPAAQTTEQKARAFISAYYDAWSGGNTEAVAFMEKTYGETVDFYGKATPKAEVVTAKRDFATRWPIRAYSEKPQSLKISCSDTCRIDGNVDWYAKRAGDRISSGTAEFAFVWDVKTGTIISESGKVNEADKGASAPIRLIAQWQEQNGTCRGGSGDSTDTLAACDRRERIAAKLQTVGWCFGREGEYGYQMDWHACDVPSSPKIAAGANASGAPSVVRKNPADFPTSGRFAGRTMLPDFKGRDREFNSFRTRIRDGMRQGPNFAGHYTLIQIGCGTGCSFAIVADNKTGQPASFPRGGEANMYLTLDYRLESRLLAAQWFSYDAGRCFLEYFDFDRDEWKPLTKADIGNSDTCYKTIEENLH